MFEDITFNKLDDISKMLEPFTYSLNDELSSMPNEIDVTYDNIITLVERHLCVPNRLTSSDILINALNYPSKFGQFYDLITESSSIDFSEKTLYGSMKLIKASNGYDEEEMGKLIENQVKSKLNSSMRSLSAFSNSRVNEVAELFDLKDVPKTRGYRQKRRAITFGFNNLFKENKILIKDVDFGFRFASWLKLYIEDGNLGAMSNLCKVKILTHKNRAIYSIENEVQV